MRSVRSLVIFVAVVFLGGGLLALWLYWLAQSLSRTFPTLAGNPFHPFLKQALPGVALIGLWPPLQSLGVQFASGIGIVRRAGQWPRLAGARQMKADVDIVGKWPGITATATVVAVMEEVLFRGALFGALRKAWCWLIDGWLAFVVLTLSLIISHRRFRKKYGRPCYGGISY